VEGVVVVVASGVEAEELASQALRKRMYRQTNLKDVLAFVDAGEGADVVEEEEVGAHNLINKTTVIMAGEITTLTEAGLVKASVDVGAGVAVVEGVVVGVVPAHQRVPSLCN